MSTIHVTPLSHLPQVLEATGARSMISLMAPGQAIDRPSRIDGPFLALAFNDIAEAREGLVPPAPHHVAAIIAFARAWRREAPLVIQCWLGVSRSTAAAVIACAALNTDATPQLLAGALRQASPCATPNPLLIARADEQLAFGGALVAAVEGIGRGAEVSEGVPFSLDPFAP